jgi:hypothetical protein
MYAITERLRKDLETATAQYHYNLQRSKEAGLKTEQYVILGKKAEYHRGRMDGIRSALETIIELERAKVDQENIARLRRVFA